jgi:hypothetical protein
MTDKHGSGLDLLKYELLFESSYKPNNCDFEKKMCQKDEKQECSWFLLIYKNN